MCDVLVSLSHFGYAPPAEVFDVFVRHITEKADELPAGRTQELSEALMELVPAYLGAGDGHKEYEELQMRLREVQVPAKVLMHRVPRKSVRGPRRAGGGPSGAGGGRGGRGDAGGGGPGDAAGGGGAESSASEAAAGPGSGSSASGGAAAPSSGSAGSPLDSGRGAGAAPEGGGGGGGPEVRAIYRQDEQSKPQLQTA
jgi:hypothetical protein